MAILIPFAIIHSGFWLIDALVVLKNLNQDQVHYYISQELGISRPTGEDSL